MNRRRFNASITGTPVEEIQPLTRETHAPSTPPSAFGRFRVVHQVGAGVLGPVFRGYDPDSGRTVALKSFPLDLTPEQASELAAGLGRLATLDLGHPSLIVPSAAGTEGSTAYLVEEYFVADSIDIAIRQYGPAPVPDAVRLVGQVAGGLDFAAAAGVHHGALHPRDVLVAPRDVRLTGIGVAEALERVGQRLPPRRPYSAPERAEPGPWDTAADVYSLAAIAYELLTGRRPAVSGNTLAIEPQAVPASDAAALAEVFARAFSIHPEDRFPSALSFAAALKHALTGQPLEASTDAERPRSRRARPGARRAAMLPLDEPEATETGPEAAPPGAEASVPPAGAPVVETRAAEPPAAEERSREPEPAVPPTPDAAVGSVPAAESYVAAPTVSSPADEPPATLLPAEASDLREPLLAAEPDLRAPLLAAEPELPEPPPALDDFDLRHGETAARALVDEPFDLRASEAPAPEEPRFTDVAPGAEAEPGPRFREPERRFTEPEPRSTEPEPAFTEPAPRITGQARRFADEPSVSDREPSAADSSPLASRDMLSTSPPLTPAYRPRVRPRRKTSAATMVAVAVAAVALAVAGGYYAASRYLGGGTQSATSATPSAQPVGGSGVASPQGQAPTASPEAVAPEPSLPAPEPPGARASTGSVAPAPAGKPAGTVESKRGEKRDESGSAKAEAARPSPRSAKSKPAGKAAAAPAPARRAQPAVFEGSLSIVSRPAGARVFLDGHPVGTTPMTMSKVSAGSHVVRLQSDGYVTWSAAIQVAAGEQNRVTASLDHLPR